MEGNMPNWCSNSIEIEGPVEKIAALWAQAQSEDNALLNALCPMPAELLEGEAWYGWRVAHWGTKWDIDMQGLEFTDNEQGRACITGWFDSAWSPPVDAFQAYSNENPDVMMELKYFEPGMGFVGVWDSEGGDAYWEGVDELLDTTAEEDAVLHELLEYFDVASWFETDDENLEIDLDGGLSATNE
jgi:Ferredoxin-like domain in Api92-like protein